MNSNNTIIGRSKLFAALPKIGLSEAVLLAGFIIVNLHLFRNVVPGYGLFALLVSVAGVTLIALHNAAEGKPAAFVIALAGYVFSLAPSVIFTIEMHGVPATMHALSRYLFAFPLVFLAAFAIRKPSQVDRLLVAYVVIVAIALLTIPLQMAIGPISWFANPGERAHAVRYASLLGSLTAPAFAAPAALIIALFVVSNRLLKYLLIVILVLAGLLTYQKSVLAGYVVVAVMYLIFSRRKSLLLLLLTTVCALFVCVLMIIAQPDLPKSASPLTYAVAILGSSEHESDLGGDVNIWRSMRDRWSELPNQSVRNLLHERSLLVGILFGGGFHMVGPALVPLGVTEYYTSHNGIIDLILIGGLAHLVFFLFIIAQCIAMQSRRCKSAPAHLRKREFGVMMVWIIFVINLMFAGSLNFHPNSAALLWTLVGASMSNMFLASTHRNTAAMSTI